MLFKQHFLTGIKDGSVRVAFRRWLRPTVKEGGTLLTAVGRLAIDEVRRVELEDIEEEDAQRAGYGDRAEIVRELERRDSGDIYRISFRLSGPDPRIALRSEQSSGLKNSMTCAPGWTAWTGRARQVPGRGLLSPPFAISPVSGRPNWRPHSD